MYKIDYGLFLKSIEFTKGYYICNADNDNKAEIKTESNKNRMSNKESFRSKVKKRLNSINQVKNRQVSINLNMQK